MSIKPWISALKVPQTTYEAWAKMHTQNESTLFWCLLNDKISSEEYFSWAKEHYGLAFLNNDFFKQEPQHALWKKISSVANWSPECLPVFEWDGVIFIACVEPQIDVRWSFKVQYVLADAVDLKMHWRNLNDGGELAGADKTPLPPPAPVAGPPSIPAEKNSAHAPVENPEATPVTASAPLEAPQGFVMNVGIAPPALDFNAPEGLKITPSLATKPASPELDNAPEGLKISPKFDFKLPSLANAAPVGLELPADMATTITPIENTSSVIQFKQASMVQPPASPMSTASDTRTAGGTVNSHSHYVEFLYSLDAHFAGGMILHVSQDQFKPLAWDSKFKPSGDKAEAFWTLNSPSAFRVAYRTQMPYLGHVVDTPINKDFFTVWGFTELPKNILIQPIKVEEKITHLILMLTDGTKKSHHLLSAGEKFAGDFLQIIRNLQAA